MIPLMQSGWNFYNTKTEGHSEYELEKQEWKRTEEADLGLYLI